MNEIWNKACNKAKVEYEYEYGQGSWDELDKYEREDFVWAEYNLLKSKEITGMKNEMKCPNCGSEFVMKAVTGRTQKMQEVGIDTSKFFDITLANGTLAKGVIEDGKMRVLEDNDPILKGITESGYIEAPHLWRRFVAAHTFRLLGDDGDWTGRMDKTYSYNYTLRMMRDEVKVLSILEQKDRDAFTERKRFFTLEVIYKVVADYCNKLRSYVYRLPIKNYKKLPYVSLPRKGNVYIKDLDDSVFENVRNIVQELEKCSSYRRAYELLCMLLYKKSYIPLPESTKKSPIWIDAFKGNGAYYTLSNMIRYHGITLENRNTEDSLMYLDKYTDEISDGGGWRLLGLLKGIIKDNGFNLRESIASHR